MSMGLCPTRAKHAWEPRYKLENYGIRGDTLKRIKALLENRPQCVVVDGKRSDFVAVLSGVPQVSVVGPVLFLVYINREFKIRRLRTTTTVKHATAHD